MPGRKYEQLLSTCGLKERLAEINKQASGKNEIEVVLGNPSCDQDSFIGSHVLAAALGRVPVVNMRREIFECKKDLIAVLEMVGMCPDDLVFLEKDQEGWVLATPQNRAPLKEKKLTLFLVDHNLPPKELLETGSVHVDRIIDHHPMLEVNSVYKKVHSMKIELDAGSCCSLIFDTLKNLMREQIEADPEMYKYLVLLTIPVLTDTSMLRDRTHEVDVRTVQELLELSGLEMEETKKMHHFLKKRKRCEAEVPTHLILQMDYKGFDFPSSGKGKTFGICSVKYSFDEWVKRDGKDHFLKEVEAFRQKKGHEFLLLNCKSHGKREFYLTTPPPAEDFVQKVLFENKQVEKREVEGDGPSITVFPAKSSLSRKIVVPKIYLYLEDNARV